MSMPDVHEKRRPRRRRGTIERPVDGRVYRGAWLLVAVALLVAGLTVRHPAALAAPQPALPPSFDANMALKDAIDIARFFPDRWPGTTGGNATTDWVVKRLTQYGYAPQTDRWQSSLPAGGSATLANVIAEAPGRSKDTIVVVSHRDDLGLGPGANESAAGTAALVELARAYAAPTGAAPRIAPQHTILFASTDGGAQGGLGAVRLARTLAGRRVVAVLDLDRIAGKPRVSLGGDTPRSPPPTLLATLAARVAAETNAALARPGALHQLVDLGFPFTLGEQGPLLARGVPAITLTSGSERGPAPAADVPEVLSRPQLQTAGRIAESLLASLDGTIRPEGVQAGFLWLGQRVIPGWAVALCLVALTVPFYAAVLDLLARCRRFRLRLGPAFGALRSRILLWLWIGGSFYLVAALGGFGGGPGRPLPVLGPAAQSWRVAGLAGVLVLSLLGWFVARGRLAPRRPATREEELAGQVAALVALGVVALLVAATNVYALLFVLPSLHLWLWVPQHAPSARGSRIVLLACGLAGPALPLVLLATHYGLGLHTPWYVASLYAVGYASALGLLLFLGWVAVGSQLAVVVAGRYAPYPDRRERGFGPVRSAMRSLLLVTTGRRRLRVRA